MRHILIIILAFIALSTTASGTVLHVPSQYSTIQAGINASVNGDTVLVAPGIYEADTIVIQDKSILLTSAEGPSTTEINGCVWFRGTAVDTTCILRGFRLNGQNVSGWPDYLVCIWDASPLVWGNIIEYNHNDNFGAGIMALESGAVVRGNVVRGNSACAYGGGFLPKTATPRINGESSLKVILSPATGPAAVWVTRATTAASPCGPPAPSAST